MQSGANAVETLVIKPVYGIELQTYSYSDRYLSQLPIGNNGRNLFAEYEPVCAMLRRRS